MSEQAVADTADTAVDPILAPFDILDVAKYTVVKNEELADLRGAVERATVLAEMWRTTLDTRTKDPSAVHRRFADELSAALGTATVDIHSLDAETEQDEK